MTTFRKTHPFGLLLCCGFFAIIAASGFTRSATEEVPYPEGYRTWTHVKSVLIEKGSPAFSHWGGFHHIYANGKAIEGYNTGKFSDGSVIVFDVLEAVSKDSVVSEGNRRLIDVMVRDADRFKATGGWGYEEFAGDSKTDRKIGVLAVTSCYSCHAYQKDNDNVFSKFRN
jgi:Cytochrome P460